VTPEGRVKKKVKAALDTLGSDCWRFMPVQTGYGAPALDYLLAIRGRFVAIETKAPGKKLTALQEGTKAAIEAAGGIVLVVWDESSLAIAMKIILALEFAPDAPQRNHVGHLSNCLRAESTNYTGEWLAQRFTPKDEGSDQQHGGTEHACEAAYKTTRRDHGAPGTPPQRRAE